MNEKRNLLKLSVFISVASVSAFLSVPAFSATQLANRKELIAQNTPGTGQPTDTTNAPVEPSRDGTTNDQRPTGAGGQNGPVDPTRDSTPSTAKPTEDKMSAAAEPIKYTTIPSIRRTMGGMNTPLELSKDGDVSSLDRSPYGMYDPAKSATNNNSSMPSSGGASTPQYRNDSAPGPGQPTDSRNAPTEPSRDGSTPTAPMTK